MENPPAFPCPSTGHGLQPLLTSTLSFERRGVNLLMGFENTQSAGLLTERSVGHTGSKRMQLLCDGLPKTGN